MTKVLINNLSGARIMVHATTDHPDSHYNLPVWVDADNIAYCQVGLEAPFYTVVCL